MKSFRRDDGAVAGVVAAILLLAACVAFLAYVTYAWQPVWIANKETQHAADVNAAIASFADATEDLIQRGVEDRPYSRAVPLGVRAIPLLGTGASSGELAVEEGPTLTVSVDGAPVLTASGALTATTHTIRYPAQAHRYALGAIELEQSDGSWVDLRSLVRAERTVAGELDLTIQAPTLTGAPQRAAGNGVAQAEGTVGETTTAEPAAGTVRVLVTGVPADAWREAFARALGAAALTRLDSAGCATTTAHYCFDAAAGANTATQVDLHLFNVAAGWSAVGGTVAVDVRS